MSQLKFKSETFIVVDYSDLDEFIRQETVHECFECVASEEWNNDSCYTISVDGKLDKYYLAEWQEFKNNKGSDESFTLRAVMNGLCSEGKLERGKYLIKVCW